jgi:hypothetical protein
MEDDQRACNGEFHTNEKGKVPPLVTTKFLTRDMGNSGRTFRIPYSVFRTSVFRISSANHLRVFGTSGTALNIK